MTVSDQATLSEQLDQVLRDGGGVMMSATQLYHPPCVVCGKPQNRYYVDLRETGVGRVVACIPCANSRYAGDEPLWINPDAPGQRATNIEIGPGSVRLVDL